MFCHNRAEKTLKNVPTRLREEIGMGFLSLNHAWDTGTLLRKNASMEERNVKCGLPHHT